jgi:excisionase family DNA binding protein
MSEGGNLKSSRDPRLTLDEAGELLGTGPDLPRQLIARGVLDHVVEDGQVYVPQSGVFEYALVVARQSVGLGHDPVLYRVTDVTRLLSLSRTVVFDLIRTGRLRSVKEGRTRLIPASAVREYLALLHREVA